MGFEQPIGKTKRSIPKSNVRSFLQRLFYTYFVKMNMGYRSGRGEYLQDGLPYSLYQLDQCANQWTSAEDLFDLILLPEIRLQLGSGAEASSYNPGISTMVYSLLRALVYFGVLEKREPGGTGPFVPASTFEY